MAGPQDFQELPLRFHCAAGIENPIPSVRERLSLEDRWWHSSNMLNIIRALLVSLVYIVIAYQL